MTKINGWEHETQIAYSRVVGYNHALYDGIDLSYTLDCQCDECINAYAEGQAAAIKDLFLIRGVVKNES